MTVSHQAVTYENLPTSDKIPQDNKTDHSSNTKDYHIAAENWN